MGKILKYQKIIERLLKEYAVIKPINWENAEQQLVFDTHHHHYQLIRMGWQDGRYLHYAIFHFDIINEKIWVRQNRTDADIEEELVERGVAAEDILLGYRQPEAVIN